MSNKVIHFLFVLLASLFLVSIIQIGHHTYKLSNEKRVFQNLKMQIETNTPTPQTVEASDLLLLSEEERFLKGVHALKNVNQDLMAWLVIENTVMDYPVMQSVNRPDYYLHRDFNLKYSLSGTPYVDHRYDLLEPQSNAIVYGHNMKDGSMFSELEAFTQPDFEPKNHPLTLFQSNGIIRRLEIVAIVETEVYNQTVFDFYKLPKSTDSIDMDAYYSAIEKYASFKVKSALSGPLLVLSTCATDHPHKRILAITQEIQD